MEEDPWDDELMNIDLYEYLLVEDDDVEDGTLVRLQNIKEGTELILFNSEANDDILFQHEHKDVLCNRLRRLLRAIAQNDNIIYLDIKNDDIRIPGYLIAEWLKLNKYVKKFIYNFYNDQSDFELLCNAIQQNNNSVTRFIIRDMELQEEEQITLLGNAFRESRGIKDIDFTFDNEKKVKHILFLQEMLGPNSTIERTYLRASTVDYESATTIGEIIATNKGLISFKIQSRVVYMLPILRGVEKSVRSGVITDFQLSCTTNRDEVVEQQQQLQIIQMIGKMNNLKSLYFNLDDFKLLSVETINTNLKGLHFLDCLMMRMSLSKKGFVINMLKSIAAWENNKCKLHLKMAFHHIKRTVFTRIINLFDDVSLEKLIVHTDPGRLVEITKHVPGWIFLKDLKLFVYTMPGDWDGSDVKNTKLCQLELAAAISKNKSIESFCIEWNADITNSDWNDDAQIIINRAITQNKFLTDIDPTNIPTEQWPTLLQMANTTGINFSYQNMSYLYNRFLAGQQRQEDDN